MAPPLWYPKDKSGYPGGGFQIENAISREEALRAMTIWAARAGFEEDLKGSIEAGKLADFVVTQGTDLMTAPEAELFGIRVEATWSGGKECTVLSKKCLGNSAQGTGDSAQ